ncbi:cobalamin biosynthesis protein [Trichloromonas sp.]|uniref:cobalamin biosynthesis protein n=1 Tax=Trichloromonas sp. TaxID=3069249 RepID=UPI001DCFDB64|nr:cobalamin biosynthesis protein [Desulfuromonadaceae bacterium]MDY0269853.1 cobalamin biosynthesis protein [Trichloromonas sp.]
MRLAAITFSSQGLKICRQLQQDMAQLEIYLHDSVNAEDVISFSRVMELTPRLFPKFDGLIYIAPCGVVVRSLTGCPDSKYKDPAIVVADVGGRHVISLLSGHEGGANALAIRIANIIDAKPVITTTTEAVKDLIVGVGCRRGKESQAIIAAVEKVLADRQLAIDRVRYIATASVKADEAGLIAAAEQLDIPLRIIPGDAIRACHFDFSSSEFVERNVGLPAVAEPAALLAGWRTSLIVQKQALDGITVAVARENCSSLA